MLVNKVLWKILWFIDWIGLEANLVRFFLLIIVQCSAMNYIAVQYSALQCVIVQWSAVQSSVMQWNSVQCTVQFSITLWIVVQCVANVIFSFTNEYPNANYSQMNVRMFQLSTFSWWNVKIYLPCSIFTN